MRIGNSDALDFLGDTVIFRWWMMKIHCWTPDLDPLHHWHCALMDTFLLPKVYHTLGERRVKLKIPFLPIACI